MVEAASVMKKSTTYWLPALHWSANTISKIPIREVKVIRKFANEPYPYAWARVQPWRRFLSGSISATFSTFNNELLETAVLSFWKFGKIWFQFVAILSQKLLQVSRDKILKL